MRSKQRVADHGEVFTPAWMVEAMLDLVKPETERIDARVLEPACGSGNFLVAVLRRKLAAVELKFGRSEFENRGHRRLNAAHGASCDRRWAERAFEGGTRIRFSCRTFGAPVRSRLVRPSTCDTHDHRTAVDRPPLRHLRHPTDAMWNAMRSADLGWATYGENANFDELERRDGALLGAEPAATSCVAVSRRAPTARWQPRLPRTRSGRRR
jgi:hypothetical protein